MSRSGLLFACAVASTRPLGSLGSGTSAAPYLVWHLTDVHVDPWYTVGSDATRCYCETTAACKVTGSGCANASSANASALPLGNSEGNCATPHALYESAAAFMGHTTPKLNGGVYFTGDFAEAGASYPCHGSAAATAQRQILDIMAYDWATLKAQLPDGARLYGSLGNHDSVPGDKFYAAAAQAWQYKNLTSLWAHDLAHDPIALATVKEGGYYATRAAPGLTVISLNVNYWCTFAPPETASSAEAQFDFFAQALAAAESRGDAVHILGHEPPGDEGATQGGLWHAGFWARYTALCDQYKHTIKAQLYGHIHTDQWTLTRSCRNTSAEAIPSYKETTGIKWCSGGGDYYPSPVDVFGAGSDNNQCPLIPASWSTERAVEECKKVCSNATACLGFTMYFNETKYDGKRECCFRAGSVASKPPCPQCTARCYEKPPTVVCDGPASGVLLPGPSLTEGWPATNPAIRLLKFDPKTYELLDATTFTSDLHEANRLGRLDWKVEYEFKQRFDLVDMSAKSFEELASRLLNDQGGLWQAYKGQGDGSLYCKGYSAETAPFSPIYPCKKCTGQCRSDFVSYLNATALKP